MRSQEAILIALFVVVTILVIVLFVSDTRHSRHRSHRHSAAVVPITKITKPTPVADTFAPSALEDAQRAVWSETVTGGDGASSMYNPEISGDNAAESAAFHTPSPAINYQDTLIDIVSDSRMKAQQDNWYKEVAPKSQTAMRVDDIEEAAAMSAVPRVGLYAFRLAAPKQVNPLFITESDAKSYAAESTGFSFGK